MHVSNLILEITRRCNMRCPHCLRGDAENIDMSPDVMKRTLDVFSDISEITFSGGEPSLNVNLIRQTLDELKTRRIYISSFFIATNGKENVDELLSVCDELYYYCNDIDSDRMGDSETLAFYFNNIKKYANEPIGGLALSLDQYHEPIPCENAVKIASRIYSNDTKITTFGQKYKVIDSGRAKSLNVPYKRPGATIEKAACLFPEDYDGPGFETIYITATGDILGDCDTEYKGRQAKYNIMDPDIMEKLKIEFESYD